MKRIVIFTFIIMLCVGGFSQRIEKNSDKSQKLDYSQPIHTLGVSVNAGFSFLGEASLDYYRPQLYRMRMPAVTPEFVVHYSCIVAKNFGFAIEVPFGLMIRRSIEGLQLASPYVGISPKLIYHREIGRKTSITAEGGLKFMPFSYRADNIGQHVQKGNSFYWVDVDERNYFVPDATFSLLFNFHGKNERHNFVLGLTGNISFVERLGLDNVIFPAQPNYEGPLHFGWRSSSIGITIGYRFMGLRP